MILLDTHVLLWDTLSPEKLSPQARLAIADAMNGGGLAWADISLWETAMLAARGRLPLPGPTQVFLDDMLLVRQVRILPITTQIAELSQDKGFLHGDPADRLIAATAQSHGIRLVTADEKLRALPGIQAIW